MALESTAEAPAVDLGTRLLSYEKFWRDHYTWLQTCGYTLRPRYHPEWVPSWKGTKKNWVFCEDAQDFPLRQIIDATRALNGELVALKKLSKTDHPYEVEICQFFSSAPMANDPQNHCIPIYEVLQVPDDEDLVLLVMPFTRPFWNPRFDTFGEVIAFFQQIFEGLHFMHKNLVAHRDCNSVNIMLDPRPLYPNSFHPVDKGRSRDYKGIAKHFTRTQRPSKYYLIDFGISRRYGPDDDPSDEDIIVGGDKSPPEFDSGKMERTNYKCNPFHTDIYYLGNMIRNNFIQSSKGFDFMEPLVADMRQEDPTKRPTIDEVLGRFAEIRRSLSGWKLRSRVVKNDDSSFVGFFRTLAHWRRRLWFILRRVPAVPLP
ncbi:hypothetical protein JAAARDRAFT_180569 [Jaapia argillacea MUCL 33604]|uniref:Protein kinase domain-containing protein n=1 Tax=Jaapia argillacea MUCL 33604 TaxID=933084 RepID=A0A067PZI3_9AGAM|nr:hypothetical protein JAAARDRAFT_180569 [Jaapia argillacea MUCL 33604]